MSLETSGEMFQQVCAMLQANSAQALENLAWLRSQMDSYFFITMQQEAGAVCNLAQGLSSLAQNQKLTLADRNKTLILARLNQPGSLYDTLSTLQERDISYAEFTHSLQVVPGLAHGLEVQGAPGDPGGPALRDPAGHQGRHLPRTYHPLSSFRRFGTGSAAAPFVAQ
jgi:hypothetical protein